MQKLSAKVLEKMFAASLTAKEIDFILYIGRFQNDCGYIEGIYYKDVCRELDISYQSFYDIKKSLQEKGIVKCQKKNYFDWDMTILDNDFSQPESFSKGSAGYVNLNHQLFRQKNFLRLKAGAKLMAIDFLKINLTSNKTFIIGTKKLISKYMDLLEVGKRTIQEHLSMLRLFFHIGIKEKKYYITARSKFRKRNQSYENEQYLEHVVEKACRRNRIKDVAEQEIKDVARVLRIYAHQIKENLSFDPEGIIKNSLVIINENVRNRHKWRRLLRPSLVNRLTQEALGIL